MTTALSKPHLPTATVKLVFNCSAQFPVPSESLVLNAIVTLLRSRSASIPDTVKVLGFYYNKISDNSYEVVFIFSVNVIMPKEHGLQIQILTSIDNTLNRLLNEPEADKFESQSASFRPKTIEIHTKIEFRNLTNVPSEDEVLKVVNAARKVRKARDLETQMQTNAVSLLNITYEKTGSDSYSIDFEFSISNLSSILNAQDPGQFTYPKVMFSANSSTILAFQVYVFNGNDIKAPSGLLVQLLVINGQQPTTTTTVAAKTVSAHQGIAPTFTSAEILTRLEISNSSFFPCESLVNSSIQTLINNHGIKFPDNVTLMNYNYQKISDTSYAIEIHFYMTSVRMNGNNACVPTIEENIKTSINGALNTLLNKPSAEPFKEVKLNFTGCSHKPINYYMEYSFQDGSKITPESFIEELWKQNDSTCPKSNPVTPSATSPTTIIGNVYIFIKVIFENLTNIPTEAEVVSAANALQDIKIRTARALDTQILSDPISIKNITYQKMGNNSYNIDFAFKISNVSMPVLVDQRNVTYDLIQSKINSLMNTILNAPNATSVNFSQAIYMNNDTAINAFQTYIYKEGDISSPSGFLVQLLILHNPPTNGSAEVQVILVFNSSSPVLNGSEVLSAIKALLNDTLKNITDLETLLNITYEEISNTSYAVNITFNISNISMPTNPDLRNDTYTKLEDIINNTINALLNKTAQGPLAPSISNFTSSEDKVNGYMQYNIPSVPEQPGNVTSACRLTLTSGTTPTPNWRTSSITLNGSAEVQVILVFNSSSPVLNGSEVLSAIKALLNDTLKNITDLETLLNITYEEISNTSYAVNITFNISNISMPTNPDLRNDTYTKLEDIINNTINALLNKTAEGPLAPSISNFTSSEDKVNGYMQYNIPSVPEQPGNVTSACRLTLTSGTTPTPNWRTSSITLNGSAEVQVILVFNSSSPVLNGSEVLSAIKALLNDTLKNITDLETLLNITYEEISNTSYAVNITFNISNISMPTNPDLRNDTYTKLEDIINNTINALLNKTAQGPLAPSISNFTSSEDKVNGYMQYNIPSVPEQPGNGSNGSAEVQVILVFNSSSPVLNGSEVLSAIKALLNDTLKNITDLETLLNITYEEISNTSYAVNITFNISNISMPTNPDLRNDTYTKLEDIINNTINALLNKTAEGPLAPSISNFTSSEDKVNGYMQYNIPSVPEQPGNGSNGSAEVQVILVFNSSSPVLNGSEVLSAIKALLNDTLKNITDLETLLNITYEEISNTSYAVNITFNISNISMPTNPDLRNDTYTKLEDIINNTINALLNKTAEGPLAPSISNFTSSEDKVNGYMQYNIPSVPEQPGNGSNGSAEVQVILVFNSSSPVLNGSEVLSAIKALLNDTLKNITDLETLLNITYEEISNTSYAVNITFNISNISMPTNPDLRNDTYTKLEDIINNTINALLNKTAQGPLAPSISNFTSSEDKVNGYMQYNIPSVPEQPGNGSNGSAEVQVILVFNSSSPVLNGSEVLSAIKALLNDTLKNITDLETLLNITYEEISNTSYAVNITFNISNISMPTNPDLRNDTYTKLEDIINNTINALLNKTAQGPLAPSISNFTSSEDKVNGYMQYNIPSVPEQPGNVPLTSAPAQNSSTINGSAEVQVILVFNSSSPVLNGSEVLSAIKALLNDTLKNITDLETLLNITYEEISNTSYAVNITFNISNISMPTNPDLRNDTYTKLEDIINNTINALLNKTAQGPLAPSISNFTSSEDKVNGYMQYNIPSIPSQPGTGMTPTPKWRTSSITLIGTAFIYITLIFQNLINVPTEAVVLKAANDKLESKFKRQRDTAPQNLEQPVSIHDIIYNKTADNSFSLDLAFKIANVNLSAQCDTELNSSTYKLIQNEINDLMNTILTNPQTPPFNFPWANFTCNSTAAVIVADMIYVYKEADIQSPSLFLYELLKESGLLYYTLSPLVTIQPYTASGNSTYTGAAWILGFVIPCGIVLILLPCWILLCCLLCGCCARIRRRWHRRYNVKSHNVQYQTHNSLF
ncbi:hypothetical protein KOW79_002024 [Hemibagrus wyckioides]|uniref:Uncharacterized protein n=1 Tax=Hemibagrus wyckioides TaxID=337641 RepID=A0A9D3P720_9TELE|nr:hypothetical protein KOW79_002024 [Hemibagrus wyckioides]